MGLVSVKILVEEEDVKQLLDMIDVDKLNSATVTFRFKPSIDVKTY